MHFAKSKCSKNLLESCSKRLFWFPNGRFVLKSRHILARDLTHHSPLETGASTFALSCSSFSDMQLKDMSGANENQYRFSPSTCSDHQPKRKIERNWRFRSRESCTCNKHRYVFVQNWMLSTALPYLQHPPMHHKCMNITVSESLRCHLLSRSVFYAEMHELLS